MTQHPAYLTTVQAAAKFGISRDRIHHLASTGHIPGAMRVGKLWLIPAGWVYVRAKPGRKKKATGE